MNNYKLEKLINDETIITTARGNSMQPRIKSGQKHKIVPAQWFDVGVGDIVYCKVKNNYYTHIVKKLDKKLGCLIGNNRGNINEWTKNIYGRVVKIY